MLSKFLIGAVLGTAAVATPTAVLVANAHHTSAAAMPADQQGAAMQDDAHGRGDRVHVILRNAQGEPTGYADLLASQTGTLVSVRAWGLTPGFHGFHIHSAGVCDPNGPVPFQSAGGHFNPAGTAEGMQAGAFPVLLANSDGIAAASFRDGNFTLKELFGPSGTSLIVHAMPDNYANIPARYTSGGVPGPDMETTMTGDGGARVACGVIARPTASAGASPSASPTMPMSPQQMRTATSAPAPSQPAPSDPAPSQPAPATSAPVPAPTTPAPVPSQPVPPSPSPTASAGPSHF